jgi:hypothetical protein
MQAIPTSLKSQIFPIGWLASPLAARAAKLIVDTTISNFCSYLERQMDFDRLKRDSLVHSLRDSLPLPARPRPALLAFLRLRGAIGRGAPKLVIVDIFDTAAQDLMCRFVIEGEAERSFVAPLAQISLDRRHPLAQRLAARRRNVPRPGGRTR